jgi:nucleotide-binding universal stress UspA family protein
MYTIKNILVTTDFSEYSAAALDHAISLAKMHHATLSLLHVVSDHEKKRDGKEERSKRGLAACREMRKFVYEHINELINVEQVIRHGVPHREIIRYVKEHSIDIIVMATHGRTGLAHALAGSVAEKVVRYSPVPVLVVKPSAVLEKIVTEEDIEQNLHLYAD